MSFHFISTFMKQVEGMLVNQHLRRYYYM